MSRDEILLQALALSPEDRAYLANMLESSLESEAAQSTKCEGPTNGAMTGDEFRRELHRRSAAYRINPQSGRLASDVLSELKQRQANEMAQ